MSGRGDGGGQGPVDGGERDRAGGGDNRGGTARHGGGSSRAGGFGEGGGRRGAGGNGGGRGVAGVGNELGEGGGRSPGGGETSLSRSETPTVPESIHANSDPVKPTQPPTSVTKASSYRDVASTVSATPASSKVELGFDFGLHKSINDLIAKIKKHSREMRKDRTAYGAATEGRNELVARSLDVFLELNRDNNNVLEIDLQDVMEPLSLKLVELYLVLGCYFPGVLSKLKVYTRVGRGDVIKKFLRDQTEQEQYIVVGSGVFSPDYTRVLDAIEITFRF